VAANAVLRPACDDQDGKLRRAFRVMQDADEPLTLAAEDHGFLAGRAPGLS
jgi:hypothetical protein